MFVDANYKCHLRENHTRKKWTELGWLHVLGLIMCLVGSHYYLQHHFHTSSEFLEM